jgi:hypothetical protein
LRDDELLRLIDTQRIRQCYANDGLHEEIGRKGPWHPSQIGKQARLGGTLDAINAIHRFSF